MSELKVDKISPLSGTAATFGDSGDTFTVPSGATLTIAGALNVTGTTALADGTVAIAELDIDGGTDIGAAIVDGDLFIVDDGAGGANRKTAASSKSNTCKSGRPEVVSASVIPAQPFEEVGRIAAAGTHMVCVPTMPAST